MRNLAPELPRVGLLLPSQVHLALSGHLAGHAAALRRAALSGRKSGAGEQAVSSPTTNLERYSQRQLDLARIEYSAGSAVARIG